MRIRTCPTCITATSTEAFGTIYRRFDFVRRDPADNPCNKRLNAARSEPGANNARLRKSALRNFR